MQLFPTQESTRSCTIVLNPGAYELEVIATDERVNHMSMKRFHLMHLIVKSSL